MLKIDSKSIKMILIEKMVCPVSSVFNTRLARANNKLTGLVWGHKTRVVQNAAAPIHKNKIL